MMKKLFSFFLVGLIFCLDTSAELLYAQWRRVTDEASEDETTYPQGSGWRRVAPEKGGAGGTGELSQASEASGQLVIDVLINNSVKAALILDTGAGTVFLSKAIAEKLGIATEGPEDEPAKAQLADGRIVDVKYVTLDSVMVEGQEAKDVGAAVILDDAASVPEDGLLGMSFLKNFKFTVDYQNNTLILQKSE